MNISRKDETNALQFIQNMVFTGKVKQAETVQGILVQRPETSKTLRIQKQPQIGGLMRKKKQGITLHPETLKIIAVVIITILSTLI